jgi:hypothetical protein
MDFLARNRAQIATFLLTHPVAVESKVLLLGTTFGSDTYTAEISASDWNKAKVNERDFFLAFGKVSVLGRVESLTLYRNHLGGLVLNEMEFSGSIVDTEDFNIKATITPLSFKITKPAAELQAGAPTLGASGAIFRDSLTFDRLVVAPQQFGVIELTGL